jgi:hypothetical protein
MTLGPVIVSQFIPVRENKKKVDFSIGRIFPIAKTRPVTKIESVKMFKQQASTTQMNVQAAGLIGRT